jgi:hypothetical protein
LHATRCQAAGLIASAWQATRKITHDEGKRRGCIHSKQLGMKAWGGLDRTGAKILQNTCFSGGFLLLERL